MNSDRAILYPPPPSLLFTIAFDSFSCLIEKGVNLGIYNPIRYGHCWVSYLLFNDLIVSGLADHTTTNSLKRNLEALAGYLGLEQNKLKSFICFSKRTKDSSDLCRFLVTHEGHLPFKYFNLGFILLGALINLFTLMN